MKHRPKKPADPTTPKRPKSPRPRRRTTRAERTAPPADAPYWLVAGDLWNHLPPAMCQAVVEILTPAYQRLVRDASDELERSAGITLIHLLWLEISEQLNMASVVADRDSILAVINDPDTLIAQHLRLVTAKNATSELILKLRMAREMFQRGLRPGPPLGLLPPRDALDAINSPHPCPYPARSEGSPAHTLAPLAQGDGGEEGTLVTNPH